jgi:IS4 transposase
MVMNAVIARCAEKIPVTLMARLTLQYALDPSWMDTLFKRESGRQYQRELMFSTAVELMSIVAVGSQPSLHAAAKASPNLNVSLQALYDKIKHTEPNLVRALVSEGAARLNDVLAPMIQKQARMVPGYQVRIVDGSHLPATEKRLKPLRGFGGASLPGHSLVVYDPDTKQVIDIEPCEDAYTQERLVMSSLLERAKPGELWIADRAFSTRPILREWHRCECAFIVREHKSTPNPEAINEASFQEHTDTGEVYAQEVEIKDAEGAPLRLRRIELRLKKATESGETIIRILTNLPKEHFKAGAVASLYRHRWKIESMFQRLESVLNSEVKTLGHPHAALLAFGIAVLAYNVLSVLQAAVWEAKELDKTDIELSPFYVALEVRLHYPGMMMLVPDGAWKQYDTMGAPKLSRLLLEIAASAKPQMLRKHPRGPKTPKPKSSVSAAERRRHVSTARVLRDGVVT